MSEMSRLVGKYDESKLIIQLSESSARAILDALDNPRVVPALDQGFREYRKMADEKKNPPRPG